MIYPHDFEEKLGFDKIKEKLLAYAPGPLGRTSVINIAFSSNPAWIEVQLARAVETVALMAEGHTFPAQGYIDPENLFHAAAIEGQYIEEEDFVALYASLQTIATIQTLLKARQETCPQLYALSSQGCVPPDLLKGLQTYVQEGVGIKDNATPELSRLRKALKLSEHKIHQLTDKIFREMSDANWVPEGARPTVREGRAVIPIRAEYKRKINGIIADESATGQTIFVEPAALVEAGNTWRDLQFSEKRELILILKKLTAILREFIDELRPLYLFLSEIELNIAKAKIAIALQAVAPILHHSPALQWRAARHPLLFLKKKEGVVPLSISMEKDKSILLISGPNAGGKSVCIKTVALLQYMLQCGLLIPMESHSVMGVFKDIFIDIGDQQSIENDLSTYSSHLKNMAYFIEHSGDSSLVILDELGSGTDPNFGGGIAEAILERLQQNKVWVLAATHYYNLKLMAEKNESIQNAAMLFDTQSLKPLYQLEIGRPGSSFALEIARSTGIPEAVLNRAQQIVGKDLSGVETLLQRMMEEKTDIEKKKKLLQQEEASVKEKQMRYDKLHQELSARKQTAIAQAKIEAANLLKKTNREIEKTIRHIKESKANQNETRKVRKQLEKLSQQMEQLPPPPKLPPSPPPPSKIGVGSMVRLPGQDTAGRIINCDEKMATIQLGNLHTRIPLSKLQPSVAQTQSHLSTVPLASASIAQAIRERVQQFKGEIDIRGKRAQEVTPLIEKFIDDALVAGYRQAKIIHGTGEGILGTAVHNMLRQQARVKSYKYEHADFGGAGVTLIEFT